MSEFNHKKWCAIRDGWFECTCGYYEEQKEHSSTCYYPSEPCNCNHGKSKYDIDNSINEGSYE